MDTAAPARTAGPRVWLAGIGPAPTGAPVRDDQQRIWVFAAGRYHTTDHRHHETPARLHARTDLVAVG